MLADEDPGTSKPLVGILGEVGGGSFPSRPRQTLNLPRSVRNRRQRLKPKAAGPSGPCLMGDLPLLEDPDGVAEWVADAHVGAVEVVGGLLGEVGDAARLEGLVQIPDVVRLEHEPS